jgi:succinoglycan biosynthesis transport protein ExoP
LVNDQRLADLNDKLTTAHDDTLKAKAWLDELTTISDPIVSGEIGNLPNSDGTKSDLLEALRRQYLDTSSQEAESLAKLGPNNPVIISLRSKKAQLRSEISEEIKHLNNSSKSEYEAAKLHESTIKKELDMAMIQSQTAKQAPVQLLELESSVRAHQDMYNTFLNRYNASL